MNPLNFLDSRMSWALGWSLVHSLWEGGLIAAALATFRLVVGSARFRYLAACGALLALLFAFLLTFFYLLPQWSVTPRNPQQSIASAHVAPVLEAVRPGKFRIDDLVVWLAPVWLVGVCFAYVRFGVSWILARRFRRKPVSTRPLGWQSRLDGLARALGITKSVVLIESLHIDTPAVLGFLRPVVLVPFGFLAGMSTDDIEAILLHELAHIKRWDYLVNICQRMIEALLFYHPAAWWISRVICTEREHCCDDLVVHFRGEVHGYATALTRLEQLRTGQSWASPALVMNAKGGSLVERITRLLYPRRPIGPWAPASAALALLASTAMALSAWHLKPLLGEPSNSWEKWLDEEVVYIITDDERTTFERLQSDDDRRRFAEQFWLRRDPTLGTAANEYKEEHYRRIAYANKHFDIAGPPGWKTDRGRVYIRYGPPDEIDSHPNGGKYERSFSEGGGSAFTYPFEDWLYSHFEGVGRLNIEFVDLSQTGEFRMTLNPKEKYRQP